MKCRDVLTNKTVCHTESNKILCK